MPTVETNLIIQGGGISISGRVLRTVDSVPAIEVALPAGKAGQLTTRTDDETGTLTMASGHGITTGAIIDLYWDGGSRRTNLVGTVAGLSVPINAAAQGVGDVLPANLTNIVACVRTIINFGIDGDNCSFVAANLKVTPGATGRGNISLEDAADDLIADIELTGNEPQILRQSGSDLSNVLTGDPITQIHASNGSSTVAATLQIICAADVTP